MGGLFKGAVKIGGGLLKVAKFVPGLGTAVSAGQAAFGITSGLVRATGAFTGADKSGPTDAQVVSRIHAIHGTRARAAIAAGRPSNLPMLPGGFTADGGVKLCKNGQPRRIKLNGQPYKCPSLNPANVRALRRSIRRIGSAEKIFKKVFAIRHGHAAHHVQPKFGKKK